jgi:hypothetical protein
LYRQHRDEIDTLSDPTTLFILDFASHYGHVQLDELAGDLGLSPTALRKKITPLLRGQMIVENDEAITVTTLGKRLLDYIDFLPPLALVPDTSHEEPIVATPQPTPAQTHTPSVPSWLWGIIVVLGIVAIILILILVIELGLATQNSGFLNLR